MSWEDVAKLAPIATASIALCALVVAWISIWTQKAVARRRAAIDVFLKTEMDKEMLAAYSRYTAALEKLQGVSCIEDFACSSEYQSIRTYLDINELIAIGINRKVFDQRVCYGFWYKVLTTACRDAEKVIAHARNQRGGEQTYDHLLLVNARWSGRTRIWQRWRV
jgi:hypothetical protein